MGQAERLQRSACVMDTNHRTSCRGMWRRDPSEPAARYKIVQAKNGEFCLFLFAVYNPDKNFDELTH